MKGLNFKLQISNIKQIINSKLQIPSGKWLALQGPALQKQMKKLMFLSKNSLLFSRRGLENRECILKFDFWNLTEGWFLKFDVSKRGRLC